MNATHAIQETGRWAGAGATAVVPPPSGPAAVPDIRTLRDALAADLVAAVVVAHPGGRDGMGEVGEVAVLSGLLDRLDRYDAVELVTPTRVLRLVRSGEQTVAVAFIRRAEGLARIDWIMPVEFRPSFDARTVAVPSDRPATAGVPREIDHS